MSEIRETPLSGSTGGRSEQIQGHPLQRESTHLRDQLADLLLHLNNDAPDISDIEDLDALLDRLEEVIPLPDSLHSDTEMDLEQFHREHASIFDAVKAAPPTPPLAKERRTHSSFARLLPAAAVLVISLCTVSAQAFGLNVFTSFVRWTSEIFHLSDSTTSSATVRIRPLEEGEETTYDTLEEALAAFGIDAPIVPKEIPERFELVEVIAAQRVTGVQILAVYESKNGSIQIQYKEENLDFFALEKEYGYVDFHDVENVEHYLLSDLGRQKAIWQNGDFECVISGDVSEQEIKTMIDSIYKE